MVELSARGLAGRLAAMARNATEVARFGGLDTGEEPTPYEVVHEHPTYRLRRYGDGTGASPIVLVPPLMLSADVYDVSPATSAVRILTEAGIDTWVVDFGAPEEEEGGLARTLNDHILAVSDAVERVGERTGRPVHLSGYSQGGMFAYQTAAYRRGAGIASVVTFGSPVDTQGMLPFGLPEELTARVLDFVGDNLLGRVSLPAWASRTGFRLLDPAKSIRQRVDFVLQLHDREALLPRERQRRFLQNDGWVAWPGPALADLVRQIVAHNRMIAGGFVVDETPVTLADITCPLLCFVGGVDEIAAPGVVRAIRRAAPLAEIWESPLDAGHFGLVVGSLAAETTWPTVAEWCRWRDGGGPQPAAIGPLVEHDGDDDAGGPGLADNLGLAVSLGAVTAEALVSAGRRGLRTMQGIAADAVEQLPRLTRLQSVRPSSRVSLGLLLAEQAARAPEDTVFLFDGRGHTYADADRRIDNVVRGLVSLGVRHGEHVGVLMDTRPSALTAVAALNRLGAVAVLLRPTDSIERELRLGKVGRVVVDPEHVEQAVAAGSYQVLVLGGGGRPRDLGDAVVDMERIDPAAVELPGWYAPNPGRARDLAFILFTGDGESTRVNRITNGRWALSAFGTASAAALTPSDTVYGVTPLHHPSALLTSVGGAVAGGSRLAMTASFEPDTFWDEVRRYGVTVVSYTWTLVHDLLEAPPNPLEQHHPVRLFLGSGMPSGLWRRVTQRFAPAQVLEFYASTEGEAVLVNLTGEKVGGKGRPLPGSAEVRVARFDIPKGRLVEGPDGFAVPCGRGEIGMLLARVAPEATPSLSPLRGVFSRGDAWLTTGDLFRRDGDGDYWLVDHVTSVVRTAAGPVASVPVEDVLMTIDAVDLAAVYGVPSEEGGHEQLVGAVTVRRGTTLTADDVAAAVATLEPVSRPIVVRVLDDMPTTGWYRVSKAPLRAAGLPPGTAKRPVFRRDPASGEWHREPAVTSRRRPAPRG